MTIRDSLPSEQDWTRLSAIPEKRAAYAQDLYFRECWADVQASFGKQALTMLDSLAILCAKPDAVVSRRLGPMLDYAVEHGFVPLATAPFEFTRHSMREIWRYDWHAYPAERLVYSTMLFGACGTLLFALHDSRAEGGVPGSVRLSDLKGDGQAHKRRPTDMRSVLGPPNRLLNFVHIPDEPADIVRELGILFDTTERRALLEAIMHHWGQDRRQQAIAAAARLEAHSEQHDLDVRQVLRRLHCLPGAKPESLARLAQAVETGTKLRWDTLCALQPPDAAGLARWDFLCLASALLHPEREVRETSLMPASYLALWTAPAHRARV